MKVTATQDLVFGVVLYKKGETFVIPERKRVGDKIVDVPRWQEGPSVKGAPDSPPVPKDLVGKPKAFNPLSMREASAEPVTAKGKGKTPLVTGHEDPEAEKPAEKPAENPADKAGKK